MEKRSGDPRPAPKARAETKGEASLYSDILAGCMSRHLPVFLNLVFQYCEVDGQVVVRYQKSMVCWSGEHLKFIEIFQKIDFNQIFSFDIIDLALYFLFDLNTSILFYFLKKNLRCIYKNLMQEALAC